jgi:hypothetical protein
VSCAVTPQINTILSLVTGTTSYPKVIETTSPPAQWKLPAAEPLLVMAHTQFPIASAAMLPHINSPKGVQTTLPPRPYNYLRKVILFVASSAMLYCIYTMLVNGAALLTVAAEQQVGILKPGDHGQAVIGDSSSEDVPDYFRK